LFFAGFPGQDANVGALPAAPWLDSGRASPAATIQGILSKEGRISIDVWRRHESIPIFSSLRANGFCNSHTPLFTQGHNQSLFFCQDKTWGKIITLEQIFSKNIFLKKLDKIGIAII
jgi:hypothetical protein